MLKLRKLLAILISIITLLSVASIMPSSALADDEAVVKYNSYTEFEYKEPWTIKTYATIVFKDPNGNTKKDKYLSANKASEVSDYSIYVLRGVYGDSKPSSDEVIANTNTIEYNKTDNSKDIILNKTTSTGHRFTRVGVEIKSNYIYQMRNPVWIVYRFVVNGKEYISPVQDKCLYEVSEAYVNNKDNGFYTSYTEEKERLRASISDLFKESQEVCTSDYDMPTYPAASKNKPNMGSKATTSSSNKKSRTSTTGYSIKTSTAIRNIEPWGLKLDGVVSYTNSTATVNLPTYVSYTNAIADYGFVVYRDVDGDGLVNGKAITSMTASELADVEGAAIYSNVNGNISVSGNTMTAYYVDDLTTGNMDQNIYSIAFVVKKTTTNMQNITYSFYESTMATNDYLDIAKNDNSNSKKMSSSIVEYVEALNEYEKAAKIE